MGKSALELGGKFQSFASSFPLVMPFLREFRHTKLMISLIPLAVFSWQTLSLIGSTNFKMAGELRGRAGAMQSHC